MIGIRHLGLSILLAVVSSCGGSGWSDDEQNQFLDECHEEGGTSSYCRCYMEKVEEKYPNFADSKNLDFETAVEMAKSCE